MKEVKVGGVCDTCAEKHERRRPLGRTNPRREDDITMNIKIGRRGMNFCRRIETISGLL